MKKQYREKINGLHTKCSRQMPNYLMLVDENSEQTKSNEKLKQSSLSLQNSKYDSYISTRSGSSCTNIFKNQKYTWYSFIPLVFLHQFNFFFNIYFFLCNSTQFFPNYKVYPLVSAVGPWTAMFVVSLLKEGIEDFKRYRRDKHFNSRQYYVYGRDFGAIDTSQGICTGSQMSASFPTDETDNSISLTRILSSEIRVGNIIKLNPNDRVPADVVILGAHENHVYIRTEDLDGENDWKIRCIPKFSKLDMSFSKIEECYNGNHRTTNTSSCDNTKFNSSNDTNGVDANSISHHKKAEGGKETVNCKEFKVSKYLIDNVNILVEPPNNNLHSFDGIAHINYNNTSDDKTDNKKEYLHNGNAKKCNDDRDRCIPAQHKNVHNGLLSPYPVEVFINDTEARLIHTNKSVDKNDEVKSIFGSLEARPYKHPTCNKSNEDDGYVNEIKLSLSNVIWTNSIVMNTSVLGLVIYTGTESRAQAIPERIFKISLIDREIDSLMAYIGVSVVLFAIIFSLVIQDDSLAIDARFVKFLVLFSSAIPISLKVVLEWARAIYARRINVRNSSIIEDVSRPDVILTDKTGTLTKNEMNVKELCFTNMDDFIEALSVCHDIEGDQINTRLDNRANMNNYGTGIKSWLRVKRSWPLKTQSIRLRLSNIRYLRYSNIKHTKKANRNRLINKIGQLNRDMEDMSRAKSKCEGQGYGHLPNSSHSSISNEYQRLAAHLASNPDEIAILQWLNSLGVFVKKNDFDTITVQSNNKATKTYKILHKLPFTAESKRMGTVVSRDNQTVLYMKGADTYMVDMCRDSSWILRESSKMSQHGLRTLVVAKLELENLERSGGKLTPLGLIGIEDKLQENVRETIQFMQRRNIKIWMITGDKMETALAMAHVAGLIKDRNHMDGLSSLPRQEDSDGQTIVCNTLGLQKNSALTTISGCVTESQLESQLMALCTENLVIDGQSFGLVTSNSEALFLSKLDCVLCLICCRFTPVQKSKITTLLKQRYHICCIGDGGNDMSMLSVSNIGIGILGKEGSHATLSSDLCINKFCDLIYLSGYTEKCYYRSCKIVQLTVYRGLMVVFTQGIYSMITGRCKNVYQGLMLMAFTVLYTTLPILAVVTVDSNDRDVGSNKRQAKGRKAGVNRNVEKANDLDFENEKLHLLNVEVACGNEKVESNVSNPGKKNVPKDIQIEVSKISPVLNIHKNEILKGRNTASGSDKMKFTHLNVASHEAKNGYVMQKDSNTYHKTPTQSKVSNLLTVKTLITWVVLALLQSIIITVPFCYFKNEKLGALIYLSVFINYQLFILTNIKKPNIKIYASVCLSLLLYFSTVRYISRDASQLEILDYALVIVVMCFSFILLVFFRFFCVLPI